MLGVHDEAEEAEHDRDLQEDRDRLDHLERRLAQRRQQVGHPLAGERPRVVREVAGVDLRAAVEQQRPDHVEDHEQHEPRGAGVRPEEPRPAALPAGVVAHPDGDEDAQRDQHGHREEVLDEPEHRPGPDQRDVEVPPDQGPVRLDDRQAEDQEAPEREEVCGAGQRPLEQLALPEDLHGLGLHGEPRVRGTGGDVLPGTAEPVEHPQPAAGDHERRDGEQQTDDEPNGHGLSSRRREPVPPRRSAA